MGNAQGQLGPPGSFPGDLLLLQGLLHVQTYLHISPQVFQGSQGCKGHRESRDGAECPVTRVITAGQGCQGYQVRESLSRKTRPPALGAKLPGCKDKNLSVCC